MNSLNLYTNVRLCFWFQGWRHNSTQFNIIVWRVYSSRLFLVVLLINRHPTLDLAKHTPSFITESTQGKIKSQEQTVRKLPTKRQKKHLAVKKATKGTEQQQMTWFFEADREKFTLNHDLHLLTRRCLWDRHSGRWMVTFSPPSCRQNKLGHCRRSV